MVLGRVEGVAAALAHEVVEEQLLLKLLVSLELVEPSLRPQGGLDVELVFEGMRVEQMLIEERLRHHGHAMLTVDQVVLLLLLFLLL